MSYDIHLKDPISNQTLKFDDHYKYRGGIYDLGANCYATLNITYNYWIHFVRVFNTEKGIRSIYGLSGKESVPILTNAINQLEWDVDSDYWKPTEGNAKIALIQLRDFALVFPEGVWEGD